MTKDKIEHLYQEWCNIHHYHDFIVTSLDYYKRRESSSKLETDYFIKTIQNLALQIFVIRLYDFAFGTIKNYSDQVCLKKDLNIKLPFEKELGKYRIRFAHIKISEIPKEQQKTINDILEWFHMTDAIFSEIYQSITGIHPNFKGYSDLSLSFLYPGWDKLFDMPADKERSSDSSLFL